MERFFTRICNYFEKHRLVFFLLFTTMVAATLWFTVHAHVNRVAILSSLLVFFVLLLTYGRIELALISFIPMVIPFIWTLGVMGIFEIRFNITNIIISAFLFGLGGNYNLFMMRSLLGQYKDGRTHSSRFESSIFLSAFAALSALGFLVFSRNPTLRSLAVIMLVDIVCVMIMSQILVPLLFSSLIGHRVTKKRFPWTLWGLARSLFAFGYFVIGSILLTLAGFVLVQLSLFGKERGKFIYHWFISKYCWSLVYIMVNVKKGAWDLKEKIFQSLQ